MVSNCSLSNRLLPSRLIFPLSKIQTMFRTMHFSLLLHNVYISNIIQRFFKSRAKSGKFSLMCFVQIPGDVFRQRQVVVCPSFQGETFSGMTKKEIDNIGKASLRNFYWLNVH